MSFYIRHISPSQYTTFTNCGEQWYRRYILRQKIPPGIAAIKGTSVHKAAEIDLHEKKVTGEDQKLSYLEEVVADEYDRRVNEEGIYIPHDELPSASRLIGEGKDRAVAFVEPLRNDFLPQIQPDLVEELFELELPDLPKIIGVIDNFTADNWLSDLKTGKIKTQKFADDSTQLTIYWEYLRSIGREPRLMTIDQIVDRKNPAYASIQTIRQQTDIDVVHRKLKIMMSQIDAGIFPPASPGAWICDPKWCGYYWTCKHIPEYKRILPKRSV